MFAVAAAIGTNRGHFEIVTERQVEQATRRPVSDSVRRFLDTRLAQGQSRAPLHLVGSGARNNTLALQSFGSVRATSTQIRHMRQKLGILPQRR